MRSNFVARLGVRRESIFDVLERHGRRGRLVGIAHLLDPFGEDVVRSVTSVQPTERIDHSLSAEARRVVEEEDPDLLVLQLLAADQLGHVRGVRNPEYLDQLADTDRRVGDFLAFLDERGKLDGRDGRADGRPRPGPGDRRPRPPRLGRDARSRSSSGARAPCRGRRAASRARCSSSAATIAELLGVERAGRGPRAARWFRPATRRCERRHAAGAAWPSCPPATRRAPSPACSPASRGAPAA